MTEPLHLPIEIVNNPSQLNIAVRGMAGSPAIALDTESNSLHYYPEQLCLMQIATQEKVFVIDTITLKDITPFREVLADNTIMKIIHGADYDIRCLDRHCGFRIRNLYDTYIAARFAGITQVGLAALIKDLLGISIVKSKQLQLADWGRRPLSREAIDYAASDVFHLLALQKILDQRLHTLGRTSWVSEEFARLEEIRYAAPNLETAYLSIKGIDNLDGRGLAVLRSLVHFREEEARRRHRPPFFVMPDIALISLADAPASDLSNIPGLGRGIELPRFRQGLQQALRDGLAAPPVQITPLMSFEPMNHEQMRRFSRLKAWRISLGATLSLDPSLLWPMVSLQRLARTPGSFNEEISSTNIRNWQRDQFATSLKTYLEKNA